MEAEIVKRIGGVKMKTIVVISPCYLEAVFKEAEKYSFTIQGYGNFGLAQKGIIYTNASDVLGFVYLGNSLPADEVERKAMLGFLKSINLMEMSKKFLFIVHDSPDFSGYNLKKYKHLRFARVCGFDYVTDALLNKSLFGSILLDNYEPYVFGHREFPAGYTGNNSVLEYCPVVPGILFEMLDVVHNLGNVDDTISNDIILQRYKGDSLVTSVRKLVIAKRCSWDLKEWLESANAQTDKLGGKLYGLYKAFILCVVEGGVLDGC